MLPINFRIVLFSCFSCFIFQYGPAQESSPYELNWKKDMPILLGSIGLLGTGTFVAQQVDPLSQEAVERLDANDINRFDRSATRKLSERADFISDIFLYGSLASPAALAIDGRMRSQYGKIAILFGEAFILSQGLTTLTKGLVKRNRPFLYNPSVDILDKLGGTHRLSFYSGHTATVSVLCFFTTKVWSDYHPDSPWKPVVWTIGSLVPAVTAYTRYAAGKHFPTDVITAYIMGGAFGFLIPHFHRAGVDQRSSFQFIPGLQGPGFVFTYKW